MCVIIAKHQFDFFCGISLFYCLFMLIVTRLNHNMNTSSLNVIICYKLLVEIFIDLFKFCSRYDIATQIMQATTLQNVKRAKGIDADANEKTGAQHNVSRQQIADAKKLKRYIGQLTIAKAECEAALRKLGWDGAFPAVESESKV